jgi:hypothetical protein
MFSHLKLGGQALVELNLHRRVAPGVVQLVVLVPNLQLEGVLDLLRGPHLLSKLRRTVR